MYIFVKDFDYKIVNTDYAHYEYEQSSMLNLTDESKLYLTNLSSVNNPPSLDDFTINGQFANIPASSEYTANYETFQIVLYVSLYIVKFVKYNFNQTSRF